MKVIIAGSRTFNNQQAVNKIIEQSKFQITEVVCGGAPGVDTCGAAYAKENNHPIKYFPRRLEQTWSCCWPLPKYANGRICGRTNSDMGR
jgi:hypothetical protein